MKLLIILTPKLIAMMKVVFMMCWVALTIVRSILTRSPILMTVIVNMMYLGVLTRLPQIITHPTAGFQQFVSLVSTVPPEFHLLSRTSTFPVFMRLCADNHIVNAFPTARLLLLGGLVTLLIAWPAGSNTAAQSWERAAPFVPASKPFTLNSYDVIQAVLMIRREPALLRVGDDGVRTIVPVRSVRSVWVDFNPDAYENHQNRYDVELNGAPLDWDHLFIEYGGAMVNFRLLFTYRNQQPVPDVRYRIE